MAHVVYNPAMAHFHGHVGNLVFKERDGRDIVASKPDQVHQPNTPAQQAQREQFKLGANYAKGAMANSQTKAPYEAKAKQVHIPAFALAVEDYLLKPVVDAIDTTQYHKQVGDVIFITAHDDFEVVRAEVTLQDGNNNVLETGNAVLDAATGHWKYTATVDATTAATVTVTASVYDRPNHAGGKTATV